MAYVPPSGRLDLNWQGAQPYSSPVVRVPFSWQETDYAGIYPLGFDHAVVGAPVLRWTLFIRPDGIAPQGGYGTALVTHEDEYRPPYHVLNLTWQGQEAYTPAVGTLDLVWRIGTPEHRFVAPIGFDSSETGSHTVTNWRQVLRDVGAGDRFEAGTATVENHRQYVLAGGLPPLNLYGLPTVENLNRVIEVGGSDYVGFGTAFLQGGVWIIEAQSVRPPEEATGKPWLSFSPRLIEVAGIAPPLLSSGHTLGWHRTILPQGFDSQRFGTRIIPEVQNVYVHGADSAVLPWPHVEWKTRQILPRGFRTYAAEEQRYGRADVWNLRQIIRAWPITTPYNPDDGKADDALTVFGRRTRIENRNRVMQTYGTVFSRFGYAQVSLAARAVKPFSIEAPTMPTWYRAGMVAYRIRRFVIKGFDSALITRRTRIHNDARVIAPQGIGISAFGVARVWSNLQTLRRVSAQDQSAYGVPFVADRIRVITFGPFHAKDFMRVPLPDVQLLSRYITPAGFEMLRLGWNELRHYRGTIRPKWGKQRDDFGTAALRNVTPEHRAYGHDSSAFGAPQVRTQWRTVTTHELYSLVFGRARIADRRLYIRCIGMAPLRFGDRTKVEKIGEDLPFQQTVSLDQLGISPPSNQVGFPDLMQRRIDPEGFETLRFGSARVTANTIRFIPGLWQINFLPRALHTVSLKIREIGPAGDIPDSGEPSKATVSPFTVWTGKNAPTQAVQNHPTLLPPHDVDELLNPPKGIGRATVTNQHRTIYPHGSDFAVLSRDAELTFRIQYVRVDGIYRKKFGYHSVSGGVPVIDAQYPADHMAFGEHLVKFAPYLGPQTVKPEGFAGTVGEHEVMHFHRQVFPRAWESDEYGSSRQGPRYMPQSLHVGFPDWPAIQGFDATLYGTTWISHWVREVVTQGTDHFICDYDLYHFNERLRVSQRPRVPEKQRLRPQGFEVFGAGTPDLQHGQYFIRPDGNADQFRKAGGGVGKPPTQGIGVAGMDAFVATGGLPQPKPATQYVGGIGLNSFNKH